MAVVYCHAQFFHVSSFAPNQNHAYTTNNLKFLTSTLPPKVSRLSTRRLAASSKDSGGKITASEEEVDDLGVKAALSALRFYKREISPLLPKSCRYVPSCSEYSMEAYKKYGVVKGSVLTVWRLCRCNPLGGSGFDPPRWFDEPSPAEED